jgi:hypothetical protein
VVGVKSAAELGPRHLVVRRVSGGAVGPPRANVTMQLQCGEMSLLHLRAMQEPELGLDDLKLVTSLDRLSYLGEERPVSGHEVTIGSRSWNGSIPCPMATTSRVGHQLP